MSRAISGHKRSLPGGLEPLAWANEVWAAMDDLGLSQNDAKVLVAARYAIKAEGQPRADKMVKQARNKGVANG